MARKKTAEMQALSSESLEGASGGMSATVNGIQVDGTPSEIAEFVKMMGGGGGLQRSASMPNMTAIPDAPPITTSRSAEDIGKRSAAAAGLSSPQTHNVTQADLAAIKLRHVER
jgi:hypothetical protein